MSLANVLICFGLDGHVEIEDFCNSSPSSSQQTPFAVELVPADSEIIDHCGSCVDINISLNCQEKFTNKIKLTKLDPLPKAGCFSPVFFLSYENSHKFSHLSSHNNISLSSVRSVVLLI